MPAGDIGVGAREIGYLYGMYKKLANEFSGVMNGKSLNWGGSLIRLEATGYGCVYFAAEMLATRNETLEEKRCLVSGSANVALHTAEKMLELGARPIALSDSSGYIVVAHLSEVPVEEPRLRLPCGSLHLTAPCKPEHMPMQANGYLEDQIDPRFKLFHELMSRKVREILLISSPYDASVMEEDCPLSEAIINEYRGLNLSQPPG